MKRWLIVLAALAAGLPARAQGPFAVTASASRQRGDVAFELRFSIPAGHYLYADTVGVQRPGGPDPVERDVPAGVMKHDVFSDEQREVYAEAFTARYTAGGVTGSVLTVTVTYQGCNDELCFLPVSETLRIAIADGDGTAVTADGAMPPPPPPPPPATDPGGDAAPGAWRGLMEGFRVAGLQGGYLGAGDFLRFLDRVQSGDAARPDRLQALFDRRGGWVAVAVGLILLFGLGLNLTPCVLPMIPVNIAIIGAGAAAGSRSRGALLGGVYGLGMALAYGLLGVATTLTGAKFGALNAHPLFNAAVAVIFVLLALAMFDVFSIDLSRFQSRVAGGHSGGGGGSGGGGFLLAGFMGAVAALLAGACVAPVVISVLLIAAGLYARGIGAALLLPFVLGIGMAFPWPFLGAGLSLLPRPGKWMQRVKAAFGVLIAAFALYYGYQAARLALDRLPSSRARVAAAQDAAAQEGWLTSLDEALARGAARGQPVFVDFWATWCKNCLAMDRTTFRDAEVRRRLQRYVRVKVQAENVSETRTRAMLDAFGVVGLPTYVVLVPVGATEPGKGDTP